MLAYKRKQLSNRIQHTVFILLLLACIGFAGWLSNEYNIRSDWTAGKRHSLSNDTLQLLKQLPAAITLRSYQPDDVNLIMAVSEILQRYKNHKPNFEFKLFNPDIFIEQAKKDNVTRYGQTIIEYQGRSERIATLSEEALSNTLLRLQRGNKPKLLFVSQHGERNINNASAVGYSQLKQQLLSKGFDASSINLLQQSVTDHNAVLVISSVEKPLLDSEIKKIDDYITQGGNVLWLQDPQSIGSLSPLLELFQIDFYDAVVVDNNKETQRMLQLSHPAIIPILEYKRHPITEKMQYYSLFTTAAAIIKKTTSDWHYAELLISSKDSWAESDGFIMGANFDPKKDIAGPLSIGIAQHREVHLKDSIIMQRVVIIGDTDFLANNNLGHGANLDFIINTFNWLSEDDNLISISPKNAPDMKLNLSANNAAILGFSFLVFLPLTLLLCGFVIWYKRRAK